MHKKLLPLVALCAMVINMHGATTGMDWRALVPSMQTAKSFGMTRKQWATDNPGKTFALGAVTGALASYWLSRNNASRTPMMISTMPPTRNSLSTDLPTDYSLLHELLAPDAASFKQALTIIYRGLALNVSLPADAAQLFNKARNQLAKVPDKSTEQVERLDALTILAEVMSPDKESNHRLLIDQIDKLLNANFKQDKYRVGTMDYNMIAPLKQIQEKFALTNALEQIASVFEWIRNNNGVLQKIDSVLASTIRQNRTREPYDWEWQGANTPDNQAIYHKILLALCAITRTTAPLEYQPVIRALLNSVQQNALDSTRDDKNHMLVYSKSNTIARGLAIARSSQITIGNRYIYGPDYARDQYNLFEQLFQKHTVAQVQEARAQLLTKFFRIYTHTKMFDLFKINLQSAWTRFNHSKQQTPERDAIEKAMRTITKYVEEDDFSLLKTMFEYQFETRKKIAEPHTHIVPYSDKDKIANLFVKFITAIRSREKQEKFVKLVKQTLENLPQDHSYQIDVYNDIATKFNNIVAEPLKISKIKLRSTSTRRRAASSNSSATGDNDDE